MAKILIAEDDRSMSQFLTLALERAGHNVIAAFDGLEAIALLDTDRFDLLLTDIIMPGMDGVELSQKAGKADPQLKIMFITGFAAMAMTSEQVSSAHNRILSKPFHLNDLVEQVEKLLAV